MFARDSGSLTIWRKNVLTQLKVRQMTQSSFVPTVDFTPSASAPPAAPRLPGHLAVPVIMGLALASWVVVWQLVEAVAMVIEALG